MRVITSVIIGLIVLGLFIFVLGVFLPFKKNNAYFVEGLGATVFLSGIVLSVISLSIFLIWRV